MSNALRRGRTLARDAVEQATKWRKQRIAHLLSIAKIDRTTLSRKERSEIRRLTGRWDFWNYGGLQ